MTRDLPYNADAEESVLGAMLLSADAIADAIEVCSAEDFHSRRRGLIFGAIIALYARGEPADVMSVAVQLERDEWWESLGGDRVYLNTLQTGAPGRSVAAHHGRMVRKCSLLR